MKMSMLRQPTNDRCLTLYFAVGENALSSVLVQEDEYGQQWPVYYVSISLHGAEINYPMIEKAAYALIISARRLKPYFLGLPIIVHTNLPVKVILTKLDHSGRLSKWCFELTEFDIKYESRKTIKSQALADFILELPQGTEEAIPTCLPEWTLHIDGALGVKRKGAVLVLRGPERMKATKAIKFSFLVTNNVTEYEVLISGLELAGIVQVKSLKVYSDSNLLVQQMNGKYEVKNATLKKYVDMAKNLAQSFDKLEIVKIPRSLNS